MTAYNCKLEFSQGPFQAVLLNLLNVLQSCEAKLGKTGPTCSGYKYCINHPGCCRTAMTPDLPAGNSDGLSKLKPSP